MFNGYIVPNEHKLDLKDECKRDAAREVGYKPVAGDGLGREGIFVTLLNIILRLTDVSLLCSRNKWAAHRSMLLFTKGVTSKTCIF